MSVQALSRRLCLLLGVGVICCPGVLASPALAWDSAPCASKPDVHSRWGNTWYCPLWRGDVAVRRSARPDGRVVGKLRYGGWENWFKHQCKGRRYTYGSSTNVWWAWTMADNGGWGYVSQVFFSGGGRDEADGGGLYRIDRACYVG